METRTATDDAQAEPAARWQAPAFEVIPLGCEITAYAPDDDPTF
jgi:coenzyme PQQ precursor peptide PqqA